MLITGRNRTVAGRFMVPGSLDFVFAGVGADQLPGDEGMLPLLKARACHAREVSFFSKKRWISSCGREHPW